MNTLPFFHSVRRAAWRAGLTLLIAYAWLAGGEALADVTVTPAPGEAVRLNGPVVLPAVPGAGQQAQAVCISAAGQLGPCGAGGGGSGTYTAGTGLSVTPGGQFSIAPGYQLPQGCGSTQVLQWSGGAWVCATPAPAPGLPACQTGEVLRFGAGGLECGATPHAFAVVPGFMPQDMDSASYPAIAIDSDGLPVISYHGYFNASNRGEMRLFKCADRSCATGRDYLLDSGGGTSIVGTYNSVAIGADGLPVVSYRDNATPGLTVAKCGAAPCSTGTVTRTTVDTGNVGFHGSIAIGAGDMPVISYYDAGNEALKLLRCTSTDCAGGSITTTVDSAGTVGTYTSVAVPADGLPVISYFDASQGSLKVAKCNNSNCTAPALRTVDATGTAGQHSRIAIGHDGLPVIAYQEDQGADLIVAHCDDPTCASATRTVVDSSNNVGTRIGLAIGASGPVISYLDTTFNTLKVAACHNAACTSATLSVVDAPVLASVGTAIAIGSDGLPIIAYRSGNGGPLKVVQCSTAICRKP